MADAQNGSQQPNPATATVARGKSHQAPSTHPHKKRSQRPPKQQPQQSDGTVSDSVTNKMVSPHSKTEMKQRQQSVAIGALPHQNGNVAKPNGNKQRPVSLGGNMLPATPLKEQAYAGPTFHASPAPSSLPVPKFFSKSVPNVDQQSLEARIAGEKTAEKASSSPESDVASPNPPSRAAQQSPLDIFFQADRAEKEKSRSGSMQSPEMMARPMPPATAPNARSGKGAFLRELSGDDGDNLSPKSVPHNSRHLSLTQTTNSSLGKPVPSSNGDSTLEAHTRNLKDMLSIKPDTSQSLNATPPHPLRAHSNPRAPEAEYQTPSPFQRSTSGPSTTTPTAQQQNHYSLHYGNRNLSPLFKAARGDTPSRPSGLRQQELAGDVAPKAGSAMNMPPQPQPPPPQIDPNSFSRNYLDQQIRSSQPGQMSHLPHTNGTNTARTSSPSAPVPPNSFQHGVNYAGPPSSSYSGSASGATPRTGSTNSRDITTMEDDLRRMLNLNVLSN